MGQAKAKQKHREKTLNTPEGKAALEEAMRQRDTAWATQMAGRLFQEKRSVVGALTARFAKRWSPMTLTELIAELPRQRDTALAIAYGRASMDAYTAAMTLVAFEADLKAGNHVKLRDAIAKEIPLRLYESNDRERLEAEHAAKCERIADDTYRLALVQAFAEVSVIESVANPQLSEPGAVEQGEVGPAPTVQRELGKYTGLIELAPDFADVDVGLSGSTEFDDWLFANVSKVSGLGFYAVDMDVGDVVVSDVDEEAFRAKLAQHVGVVGPASAHRIACGHSDEVIRTLAAARGVLVETAGSASIENYAAQEAEIAKHDIACDLDDDCTCAAPENDVA